MIYWCYRYSAVSLSRELTCCCGAISVNTLRPRQNGRHFADDIFKCLFVNENVRISIKISLKFVPNGPINNIPALVQIMAWRRLGDKLLSEPMMVSLLTHICVTQPQWVNSQHYFNPHLSDWDHIRWSLAILQKNGILHVSLTCNLRY